MNTYRLWQFVAYNCYIYICNLFFKCTSWLARTDPADVARVESKTFISTADCRDVIPQTKAGVKSILGNWMPRDVMDSTLKRKFTGCMKGTLKHTHALFGSIRGKQRHKNDVISPILCVQEKLLISKVLGWGQDF